MRQDRKTTQGTPDRDQKEALAQIEVELEDLYNFSKELDTKLEIVKLKQSVEGMEGISNQVKSLTENSYTAEEDKEPSIKDLVSPKADEVDEILFESVIGKGLPEN